MLTQQQIRRNVRFVYLAPSLMELWVEKVKSNQVRGK